MYFSRLYSVWHAFLVRKLIGSWGRQQGRLWTLEYLCYIVTQLCHQAVFLFLFHVLAYIL